MNWENARNSANLLAERLRELEERTPAQSRFAAACAHEAISPVMSAVDERLVRASASPPVEDHRWLQGRWSEHQHVETPVSDDWPTADVAAGDARHEACDTSVADDEPPLQVPPLDENHSEAPAPVTVGPIGEQEAPLVLAPRGAPRKSHALPSYVTAHGMSSAIPASVIDMSATGAKVELKPVGRTSGIPPVDIPDQFILGLRVDRMEVACQLIWQNEWVIGARFLGMPRPVPDRR